jgi:hypothetical protein
MAYSSRRPADSALTGLLLPYMALLRKTNWSGPVLLPPDRRRCPVAPPHRSRYRDRTALAFAGPIESPRAILRAVERADLAALLLVNGDGAVTGCLPYETSRSLADTQA